MRLGMLTAVGGVMLALAALFAWRLDGRRDFSAEPSPRQKVAAEDRRVGWFSLTERSGRVVTLDDLRGKVWVASFFFSNCPGVCIKLNQTIEQLQSELNGDVRFVSITVDPDNDTPNRLAEYAARFHADPERWLFLTGPMEQIKHLAEASFQVAAAPAVHSDRLIVVDRTGRVRGSYRGSEETQVNALKRRLTELLKEDA